MPKNYQPRNRIFRRSAIFVDQQNFVYLYGQKICRYVPERGMLEFKDHGKGGRLTEVAIPEFVDGLQRLTEKRG